MSDFNKDEYLNDLPDMDNLSGQAAPAAGASQESQNNGDSAATAANAASSESQENGDAADGATQDGEDTLTPLGQAKKEAAEYLEALQRERAEFINFRNRSQKEQERFRQHGIIDVLTALLPALDDIDRIREHSEMDESFKAVSAKIDKGVSRSSALRSSAKRARISTRPSMTRSCTSRIRRPRRKPSTPWWKPATVSATA